MSFIIDYYTMDAQSSLQKIWSINFSSKIYHAFFEVKLICFLASELSI